MTETPSVTDFPPPPESPLHLDGRSLTPEWLAAHYPPAGDATRPQWQQQALTFLRRWLAGVEQFVLNTSGSTGRPRPIGLHRRQLEASARLTGEALGLQPGMHALACLNPAYIAGMLLLVRGVVLGLRLTVVAPTRRPLGGLPDGERYDFTALAPVQLQETLRHAADRAVLGGMRAVLIGGGPVSAALSADLATFPAPLFYHTYGMTESATHVALRPLNGPNAGDRFTPLPGVTIGQDARGCLTVRGPMTDGQTLTTNDRITLWPDGRFAWLGRIDHVINSGGIKVQAEQVESALQQLWPGRRLFVAGLPDATWGERVTAVIEGEPTELPTSADLVRAGLSDRPTHPRAWHFVPHLAETLTGKIDRAATLEQLPHTF